MKRILIAGGLALAAAGQALAADLPQAPPPPPRAPATYVPVAAPLYNWSGVYLGINGGYGFGSSTWTDTTNLATGGTTGNFDTNGWLIGGTVGANFQVNQFVFGIEGDIDWSTLKGTVTPSNGFCTLFNGIATAASCETQSDWLGTLRGRVGFAADRVLLFATAGGAAGNVQGGLTGGSVTSPTFISTTEYGWTAGGGIEFALAENWTAKAEYLYVDLGHGATCTTVASCGSYTSGPNVGRAANDSVSFTENVVRVGVNYKFGGRY